MYHALVNSYIRYGIVVWGGASSSALKPLQTLLNKAIRIISFAPYGNLDLIPAYKELQLLTVEKTYALELAKLTYKSKKWAASCCHWKPVPIVIVIHFYSDIFNMKITIGH